MTQKKLPDWKTFKEIGFIYTEEEQDYLRAIYTNLDEETWEFFVKAYGSKNRLMEAFGRLAYWFVKYQNEQKTPFNPVEWFKLQLDLATNLKKAAEKSDLDKGIQIISDFERNYENQVVFNLWRYTDYYKIVSRDFCEILGDFEKSWEFQKQRIRNQGFSEVWRYLKEVSPKPLNARIIIASCHIDQLGVTEYGRENLTTIKSVVNELLLNYFDKFGNNPLYRIINTFSEPVSGEDHFEDLSNYFISNVDFENWKDKTLKYCKNLYKGDTKKTGYYLLSEPWFKNVGLYVSTDNISLPTGLTNALYDLFMNMFRKAENEVRINNGIPKIGEGWVSETELFYNLKEHFSDLQIVQHATPKWLNGQHFDIYFPNEKIAIEYHGKQHFEPVEFFGGEENFKQQKERDLRKIKLAESNDCKLIIVRKGYDFDKITKTVNDYILR
jgi:hypothetical protein